MTARHAYSPEQLEAYYDRIAFPKSQRIPDISHLPSQSDHLPFLTRLQKHQVCKVPWENLTQHYSWHRTVDTSPRHLFSKIVAAPGRGGYCMEANHFFHTVLLTLGYRVRLAGARIYKGNGMYGGWTHIVNVVTIADTQYLLDGGFGPQGPTRPQALNVGEVETQIAPAQMRVVYEAIPQFLDRSQRVWVYQFRNDETVAEWTPMYCFTNEEFTPDDVQSMNFAPWLNRQSFFTHKVVAVRFTTAREKEEYPGSPGEVALEGEIDGALTLNDNKLKWRRKGVKVLEETFTKDDERVEALERYFGIVLSEQDRDAIKGTAAEVGAKAMSQE